MGLHFNADDERFKKFLGLTTGEKQENAKIDSYFEQYAREFGLTKDDLTEAFNVSIWAPSMNNESGGSYQMGTGTDQVGQNQIENMLSNVRQRKMALGISAESRQAMGDLTRSQSVSHRSSSGQVFQQRQSVDETFEDAYSEQEYQLENTKAKGKADVTASKRRLNTEKGNVAANNRAAQTEEAKANTTLTSSQVNGNKRIADANADADRDNARANTLYTAAQVGLNTAQQTSDAEIAAAKQDASDKNTQAQNELTTAQTRQQTATSNVESLTKSISDLDKKIKELSELLDSPNATENTQNEYNNAVAQKRKESEELEKQEKELEAAKQAVATAQTNVNTVKTQGEAAIAAAETKGRTAVSAAQLSVDRAFSDMQTTQQKNSQTIAAVTTEVNREIALNQSALSNARMNTQRVAVEGNQRVKAAESALKKAETKEKADNEQQEEKLRRIQIDWEENLDNVQANAGQGLNNPAPVNLGQVLRTSDGDIADRLRSNSALNTETETKERALHELDFAKKDNSASYRPLGTNPEAKIEKVAEKLAEEKNDDLAVKEPDKKNNQRRTFGV